MGTESDSGRPATATADRVPAPPAAEAPTRVLVVDDEPTVRGLVRAGLEREGFEVAEACDGREALAALDHGGHDLVVLDVKLPALGGLEVLQRLRERWTTPVILLSGRTAENDRVLGLELGADDYVVKPFSPRELASRVRAVLRRARDSAAEHGGAGGLSVDTIRREVRRHGELVELRAKEFDLLAFLAVSPGRVYTRAELLERVWSSMPDWQDLATVTEHVRRIRLKIEDDQEHPRWIRTVRNVGYVFDSAT